MGFFYYKYICFQSESDTIEVWIGGFLQTVNNRSMTIDCQVLDPQLTINGDGNVSSDVLCLFYHFADKVVRASDCHARKAFICETLTYGKLSDAGDVYKSGSFSI